MNDALAVTRAAAAARDPQKATDALSALSRIVDRESQAGRLAASDERALRTAIARARDRVEIDVPAAAAPAAQPPPAAQPATPVPQGPPAGKGNDDEDDKPGKPGKRAKGEGR